MPKALTANHLLDGNVVFLAKDGGWTTAADRAWLADGPEDVAALEAAGQKAEAAHVVVGPYVIEMAELNGRIWPARNREQIRAEGPTVRKDLGYQAAQ